MLRHEFIEFADSLGLRGKKIVVLQQLLHLKKKIRVCPVYGVVGFRGILTKGVGIIPYYMQNRVAGIKIIR